MIGQVIRVGIEVLFRLIGGYNNSSGGIDRCNSQEDFALMTILCCLIGGFLGVRRAERNYSLSLLPAPFIRRKDTRVLTVNYLILPIGREFYIRGPHPVLRFEVAYMLCGTNCAAG